MFPSAAAALPRFSFPSPVQFSSLKGPKREKRKWAQTEKRKRENGIKLCIASFPNLAPWKWKRN